MSRACEGCLRRGHLIACLAPRIAALLDGPRRAPAVLALEEEDDLIAAVAGVGAPAVRELVAGFDPGSARREVEHAGQEAICRHQDGYPDRLRDLTDPPAILFVAARGRAEALLEEPAVAVVGTRRASAYGLEMAYSLGRGLGAAGIAVVSGLALGIDAAAHRGCLDAGGRPIAVLAGGVDVAYPRTNQALYERVRREGAVVSELPPGTPPFRWSFPARNRIMAGLGRMTVVVEAAERSGSLITSDFAHDLGRVVGAVPGRATSRVAAGANGLLRDGARVVLGAEDVIDELFGVRPAGPQGARQTAQEQELTPLERGVLDGVEAGEGVDGIVRRTGATAAEARAALARLEDQGAIVRGRLGSYERVACR